MIKLFDEYVKRFDMNNDMISRKYYHSYRVADISKTIATSLNLNDDDINLCYLCGLFHDIGRFSQARDYNTFDDEKSIDHGDEGYSIFKKEIDSNQEFILDCIKYHNKYDVPSNLDEKDKMFINIIRDADKIDILNSVIEWKILDNIYDDNITKENDEDFFNQKLINGKNINNDNDFILRILAFIFDIKYDESLKIIIDSNIIDKIFDKINKKIFNKYYDYLKKYMEGKKNGK